MTLQDKPMTRRGIGNSIYDPLGFLAPVILPANLLLKDHTHTQIHQTLHCTTVSDFTHSMPEEKKHLKCSTPHQPENTLQHPTLCGEEGKKRKRKTHKGALTGT